METTGLDPSSQPLHHRRAMPGTVILMLFIAAALRLGLSWVSIGTNDAWTWQFIGTEAKQLGFFNAYRAHDDFNHPPLMVLYGIFSTINADRGGAVTRDFAFTMKLPAIAADILAVWLLAKIWMGRGDLRRAKLAAIAMALSPIAILISGYHCNTDDLFAYLSLLSMFLITDRRAFFWGGLALAAAINVKLIPVLLIPGTYSLCRSWREALYLTAGLAIGVIPFLPLVILAPDAVHRNMLNYAPPVSEWGITMLLHDAFTNSPFAHTAHEMMTSYLAFGRQLILCTVGGLSAFNFILRRWNGYEMATISYATLLILATGFGPQYTVMLVPLLLAISLTRSWIYGILGGIFLAMSYFSRLIINAIPLQTAFIRGTPTPPGSTFGLLAWGALLETAVMIIAGKLAIEGRKRGKVEPIADLSANSSLFDRKA